MSSRISENAQDRPYSRWARNTVIKKGTTSGLPNGDGKFEGDEVITRFKEQRRSFKKLVTDWSENQK